MGWSDLVSESESGTNFFFHVITREIIALIGIFLHSTVILGFNLNHFGKFSSMHIIAIGLSCFDLVSCSLLFTFETTTIVGMIKKHRHKSSIVDKPCMCVLLYMTLVDLVTKPMGVFLLAIVRYLSTCHKKLYRKWCSPRKLIFKLSLLFTKVIIGGLIVSFFHCIYHPQEGNVKRMLHYEKKGKRNPQKKTITEIWALENLKQYKKAFFLP